MGGHGGLNILPQKSWNVYGRENRLKVARDEAKHAEEQRIKLEKERLAESEVRRGHLLQQAAVKRLGIEDNQGAEEAQLPEQEQQQQLEAPALLQHINFFEEHEARDAHPEVAEEARKELRRRGDTATQTSDARFDERFQLGYGLGSGSAQPWYAQPKAPQLLLSQGNAPDPLGLEDDGRPLTLNGRASMSIERPANERREKKRAKADKKEKKRGHREEKKHKGQKKNGLDIEKLRQERLQREQKERERTRQAIMGSASIEGGKKYNGAYGNAAPMKSTQ